MVKHLAEGKFPSVEKQAEADSVKITFWGRMEVRADRDIASQRSWSRWTAIISAGVGAAAALISAAIGALALYCWGNRRPSPAEASDNQSATAPTMNI